jgi:hypothetical protein
VSILAVPITLETKILLFLETVGINKKRPRTLLVGVIILDDWTAATCISLANKLWTGLFQQIRRKYQRIKKCNASGHFPTLSLVDLCESKIQNRCVSMFQPTSPLQKTPRLRSVLRWSCALSCPLWQENKAQNSWQILHLLYWKPERWIEKTVSTLKKDLEGVATPSNVRYDELNAGRLQHLSPKF